MFPTAEDWTQIIQNVPMCLTFISATLFIFKPGGFLRKVCYVISINTKKKKLLLPPKEG